MKKAPHKRTQLIVIEGPDRVGKETQSKLLVKTLQGLGYSATRIEIPFNDGVTYKLIYWMLGNGLAKKFNNLFQAIQILNKYVCQTLELPRYEEQYDYVILDRWHLSSEVYGEASAVNKELLDIVARVLTRVDTTFVLLGPPHMKEGRDVYERDTEFQQNVRKIYKGMTEKDPSLVQIKADQPIESVHDAIMSYLSLRGKLE